jgi:hypothetical protein
MLNGSASEEGMKTPQSQAVSSYQTSASPKVTILPLDENCEDVTEWFNRYELNCAMIGWKKSGTVDNRLQFLSLFLSGTVLVSFKHLPESERTDFDLVKKAIIHRYGLKPAEAYRRFVSARYRSGNAVDGFVDELKRLLSFVTNLPTESLDSLVMNQLLLSLPSEVAEKIMLSLTNPETAKLVDVMDKARSLTQLTVGAHISAAIAPQDKKDPGVNKSAVRCFNCNNYGHYSGQCPAPKRSKVGRKNVQRGA